MPFAFADAVKIFASASQASEIIAGEACQRTESTDGGVAASCGFGDVSVDADADSLGGATRARGRSQPAAPSRRKRRKGRFIIRFVRVIC
jgi:hypothetical protein